MDRQLDADKDAHAKDNPHHGEDGSHFIDTKVSEGDLSEERKEGHNIRLNSKLEYRNPK
jgi:hypothetical protein